MNPELIFLGTGGNCVSIGNRSGAGMLLRTDRSLIHVDPGPGALLDLVRAGYSTKKLSAVLVSEHSLERSHDLAALKWSATMNGLDRKDLDTREFQDIELKEVDLGRSRAFYFRLPDCTVLYTPKADKSLPAADIIVMAGKPTKAMISRLKPRLMILTHFGEEVEKSSPIYMARELSELGFKVIAAEDGMVVSPMDYSASNEQKALSKFK